MDGDMCSKCNRQVHNLDAMSELERTAFLATCEAEICVSYSIPLRRTIAAAAVGASLMATSAAAGEAATDYQPTPISTSTVQATEHPAVMYVIVGGVKNATTADYIDTEEDLHIPEISVIYEDDETSEI